MIKTLIDKKFYIPYLEELPATIRLISNFDVDRVEPINLLFQSGYLTIKNCEDSEEGVIFYLTYPNKEVKIALNDYLLAYLTNLDEEIEFKKINLHKELAKGNIESLDTIIKSIFSSIPYSWYTNNDIANYEGYYASIVYSFFASSGFNLIAEDFTNKGRIDLNIIYKDKVIILEFKVVDTPENNALSQIKEKRYYEKYIGKYKEIYLMGIEFGKKERNIVSFEWERV